MKRVYGIVSCDVIDSTFLDRDALFQLRNDIYSILFPDIELLCSGFWGRVVRGDTIECCLEKPWKSFRVAFLIKCWFRDWAFRHDASDDMRRSGVRYSIGIGPMRLIDRSMDFMDGEAIYLAGRNLDAISEKNIPACFEMAADNKDVNFLIDNSVLLVDWMIEHATERQLPILYDRMMGLIERDIARNRSMTQSAVNQRARNAGWPLIKDTLEVLEQIDFERYVE